MSLMDEFTGVDAKGKIATYVAEIEEIKGVVDKNTEALADFIRSAAREAGVDANVELSAPKTDVDFSSYEREAIFSMPGVDFRNSFRVNVQFSVFVHEILRDIELARKAGATKTVAESTEMHLLAGPFVRNASGKLVETQKDMWFPLLTAKLHPSGASQEDYRLHDAAQRDDLLNGICRALAYNKIFAPKNGPTSEPS